MPASTHTMRGRQVTLLCQSPLSQNIDNGAGTTADQLLAVFPYPVYVTHVRAIYTEACDAGVSGANFKVGTTIGGAEICTATAYTASAAVTASTAGTMAATKVLVPAGTGIYARHTGVATTVAGQTQIQVYGTPKD